MQIHILNLENTPISSRLNTQSKYLFHLFCFTLLPLLSRQAEIPSQMLFRGVLFLSFFILERRLVVEWVVFKAQV